MGETVRIAVLGASGYTGSDLVRLALGHPRIEIVALAANTRAGQHMAEIWPHFSAHPGLPRLQRADSIDFDAADIVFGCLPHAAGAELLASLDRHPVIDLSADFRLDDPQAFADWYGVPHPAPGLLAEAVYGLTEYARSALGSARLVACPGCYPTAALLALLPLAGAGAISTQDLAINALSGVSGAGRGLKEANLFCELAESAAAYAVGHHRHMPEIEQELGRAFGRPVRVGFTPHLVPMNRGELLTITVTLAGIPLSQARAVMHERYADEPFVHLLPEGRAPSTAMVRGSNHCVLNIFADRVPGRAIVIAAIDNLVKGSSGQAIQNLNALLGWPETLGLEAAPLFP
jgi:N-acetyl-gamma-glutamyl-phosphate reductase